MIMTIAAIGSARSFVNFSPFERKVLVMSIQFPGSAMLPTMRFIIALTTTLVLAGPVLADSNEPISVKVNMARILRISAPAATVIIGNPGVADVTIQDPQTLVLTGKSYGQTNLIVLDKSGNPVADTMVSVVQANSADQVTVYLGAARTTLDCQPICQPTISMGDDTNFTNTALTSSNVVQSTAVPK
jgi:Flp pilus assembly secretin CpaC